MTALLASVRGPGEARTALEGGCDILDLKEPARGALGAVSLQTMERVADLVDGRRPVSATIGDLTECARIGPAARAAAATGIDLVKVGLFPGIAQERFLAALAPLAAEGIRLVAVLFADQSPDTGLLPDLAAAGLFGVMLDTSDKQGGGLLSHLELAELAAFVEAAHRLGLRCGLAGSLRPEEIPLLLPLAPDYLGFRGALCEGGRSGRLSARAMARVRRHIPEQNAKLLAETAAMTQSTGEQR